MCQNFQNIAMWVYVHIVQFPEYCPYYRAFLTIYGPLTLNLPFNVSIGHTFVHPCLYNFLNSTALTLGHFLHYMDPLFKICPVFWLSGTFVYPFQYYSLNDIVVSPGHFIHYVASLPKICPAANFVCKPPSLLPKIFFAVSWVVLPSLPPSLIFDWVLIFFNSFPKLAIF